MTKGEKRARKAEVRDHAGAVFLAQEEHAEADLDAARTAVAAASAAHSRRARATAVELALQDVEEVRQMAPVGQWERRDRLLLEKERQEEQQKEGRKPTTDNKGKATSRRVSLPVVWWRASSAVTA